MHLYVHLAASLVVGSAASYFLFGGINTVAIGLSVLGAAVLDLDHVFVIFTQKNAFTSVARRRISSGDMKGLIKHLASIERKGIGIMYAHNFISMAIVIFGLGLVAYSGLWTWAFFLGPGVLLHMILDVFDDLITIRSFRNWTLHPKVVKEF